VNSRTTIEFRKLFADLPQQVKEQTRAAYRQFKENPSHPACVSRRCIQSYQSILPELAKTIEQLVSCMETLRSGFGLVHTQITISCWGSCSSVYSQPISIRKVYLDTWKIMIPINEAQKQLQQLIDAVSQSHQPIAIAGQTSNAVLLSESDWASLQETLYLLSVPGMRESIRFGMATPIEDCDRP